MTALIEDGLTDMQRTIARQQARRQAWANPQPMDYQGAIDEHRARKAAADAAPKVEQPIGLSAGCVAAGMRFHARIGRLGDSKRLQRHYEKATAEVGQQKDETTMAAEIIPYHAPVPAPVPVWRGVHPTDMDSCLRMSKAIANSGFAPKAYYEAGGDPVAAVFAAIQLGAEIGLPPMTAVQSIAVINGKPGLYGPAMLAVVEASGKLADIEEGVEGKDDARYAYCIVQRVGRQRRTFRFSVADAKRAGLWDKRGRNGAPGPWQQYPDRMLQARARSFALRDTFPDVLLGLSYGVEELQDIPPDEPPARPAPPKDVTPKQEPAAAESHPLYVNLPGGGREEFPRTKRGLREALDFMEREVAPLVMNNLPLLDMAAEKFPDMADRIAELRAAAAEALTPATDTDEERIEEAFGPAGYDVETGELVPRAAADPYGSAKAEPDRIAQKVAERRGAAPADSMPDDLPA